MSVTWEEKAAASADLAHVIGLRQHLDRRESREQAIQAAREECTRELQSALLEDPARTVYTPAASESRSRHYTPAARVFFDALSVDREIALLNILRDGMKGEDIKTRLKLFASVICAEHGNDQCVEAAE